MRPIDADAIPESATAISTDGKLFIAWSEIVKAPTIKAVPLADIYRIIAGHSDYHGDNILAALTCIAEGKEVNPVKPLEAEPVRHGRWEFRRDEKYTWCTDAVCTACEIVIDAYIDNDKEYQQKEIKKRLRYCPNCGAKMDEEV